jgi:hypothetical protein
MQQSGCRSGLCWEHGGLPEEADREAAIPPYGRLKLRLELIACGKL